MQLTRDVYEVTKTFPREELFGLTSQMRRAAISILSNIAEGHGRLTDRAFGVFLGHARGSLYELETQIELAENLKYTSESKTKELLENCRTLARGLNAFLNTLRKDDFKGH